MNPPLILKLDDHQPSLRQIADRLLTLAQTLVQEHGVPDDLVEELATASTRCAHAYAHLESVVDSLSAATSWRTGWTARSPACARSARATMA